jgi:dihydroorotate dehydrogenase (fumarate)/dihydroorotate dehydrogenase
VDLYRGFFRQILFGIDAERAHGSTLAACRAAARVPFLRGALSRHFAFNDPRLRTRVAGIDFPNPVGLAAGFDKNGVALEVLSSAGFGALEVGSVSARASAGNPVRPRLFRLPQDGALLVYYGVPNDGAQAVAARLARSRPGVPVGVSLVETNTGHVAPLEQVVDELAEAVRPFATLADYLVLNLNCPNTHSGTSPLNAPANLRRLLEGLRGIEHLPPLFLKFMAPREPLAIDAMLSAVDSYAFVKGFILNVVPPRPCAGMRTPSVEYERLPGSITGAPLTPLACELLRIWYPRIDRERHVLVGVGGIASAEDAYRMIRLGASLVQVLTALVYRGPGLVKCIKQGLLRLLERDGLHNISQAVGVDHRLHA